ncbi:MAG: hypothetical protein BRC30_03910 [Nanohaloarchaea archaeon SW_7_46_7]|nr:MAG: hypothetical protein BRC30_03910 [Nanohaloarchaea archaeon SW_7_46_7]
MRYCVFFPLFFFFDCLSGFLVMEDSGTSGSYGDIGEDADSYLDSVHAEVSRTFDLALRQLENDELRREVRDSYLLCRIADTIEDTDLIDGDDKAELLESYSGLIQEHRSGEAGYREVADWVRDVSDSLKGVHINDLDGSGEEGSYWSLVRNAHTALSSYDSFEDEAKENVGRSIQEMAEGMADYVKGPQGIRIKDEEDLTEYCHYVAGTVGDFLTELFSRREEVDEKALRENSEDYAQLLQRINIARDPVADLEEEDAIFIPETYMEGLSHGEFKEEVEKAVESENVREEHLELVQSVEEILDSAEERADSAINYVTEFDQAEDDNGVRAYLETPLLLALATADRTEPEEAFTDSGLKIGREEVGKILHQAGNITDEQWKDREKLLKNIMA